MLEMLLGAGIMLAGILIGAALRAGISSQPQIESENHEY